MNVDTWGVWLRQKMTEQLAVPPDEEPTDLPILFLLEARGALSLVEQKLSGAFRPRRIWGFETSEELAPELRAALGDELAGHLAALDRKANIEVITGMNLPMLLKAQALLAVTWLSTWWRTASATHHLRDRCAARRRRFGALSPAVRPGRLSVSECATLAMAMVAVAGCAKPAVTWAPTQSRAASSDCRVASPEVVVDSTTIGTLRAKWHASVKRGLQTYSDVLTGVRPAYEGYAWFRGKRHGPLVGLEAVEVVDGRSERKLQLVGATNTGISIYQRTASQAGAFLIAIPPNEASPNSELIECSDCLDLEAFDLTAPMRFEGRSMTLLGISPNGSQSRTPVEARVEVRRLLPERITPQMARTLLPVTTHADDDTLVLKAASFFAASPWVSVERPATVDARYSNCEAELQKPPLVRIDVACLTSWKLEFESNAIFTTCCNLPRDHGPGGSGPPREECVVVLSPEPR